MQLTMECGSSFRWNNIKESVLKIRYTIRVQIKVKVFCSINSIYMVHKILIDKTLNAWNSYVKYMMFIMHKNRCNNFKDFSPYQHFLKPPQGNNLVCVCMCLLPCVGFIQIYPMLALDDC